MRASANNLSVFFCYQKWGKDDFFRHCAALRRFSALKRGDDSGFFAKNDPIAIAIPSLSQSHCFNVKRIIFLSVSEQNKKGKNFFRRGSPYSGCIAPAAWL
ncbi:hypothetical protein RHA96_01690 (plasmid) [Citrobacter freundii]|uniref:hypothetical protein n=1 Tax=Citrobacter freundii TaxID=546 RepID=UPI0029238B65|nr:hypothetical protein RHA96_01690 [Citrobacter freundii]